jgi:hypothetical protein
LTKIQLCNPRFGKRNDQKILRAIDMTMPKFCMSARIHKLYVFKIAVYLVSAAGHAEGFPVSNMLLPDVCSVGVMLIPYKVGEESVRAIGEPECRC